MKLSRNAVMDLPVRLMVVFLILSVSVPVVFDAIERNEYAMMERTMDAEFSRFADAISITHYSGIGSSRTVDINVPDGCVMYIGGNEHLAYSVRAEYKGEMILTRYMEMPSIMLISDPGAVEGQRTIMITSSLTDGRPSAEVTLID